MENDQDAVSAYPLEMVYNRSNTDRILGEYRVTNAESLENDFGPNVAYLAIRYRIIEAQYIALQREVRKVIEDAQRVADKLNGMARGYGGADKKSA